MLRSLFGILSRSRLAARLLFGLDLPPLPAGCHYFDVTTLALARAAKTRLSDGDRVLDMGAGSVAILGLFAAHLGCEVTATELNEVIADQARASIAADGADIEVLCGPFFANHAPHLDWVLFNPPYVPTESGLARGLPQELRSQWDGGPNGTTVIAGFLDALAQWEGAPRVLMGVNRRHVSRESVEALLDAHSAASLETVESSLLGVDVYVFSTRKSPIASASSPQA